MDLESISFHEDIYHGYQKIFKNNKIVVVIDATQDEETIANIIGEKIMEKNNE